jgi:hypothetical protein
MTLVNNAEWSNRPAAGNAGFTGLLPIGDLLPGVPEPGRWATMRKIANSVWRWLQGAAYGLAGTGVHGTRIFPVSFLPMRKIKSTAGGNRF